MQQGISATQRIFIFTLLTMTSSQLYAAKMTNPAFLGLEHTSVACMLLFNEAQHAAEVEAIKIGGPDASFSPTYGKEAGKCHVGSKITPGTSMYFTVDLEGVIQEGSKTNCSAQLWAHRNEDQVDSQKEKVDVQIFSYCHTFSGK